MAKKRCPSCGKRVAPSAPYCLYCSHRFENRRLIGKEGDIHEAEAEAQEAVIVEAGEVIAQTTDANEEIQTEVSVPVPEEAEDVTIIESEQDEDVNDDVQSEETKASSHGRLRFMIYGLLAFLTVAAVLLYILAFRDDAMSPLMSSPSATEPNTFPTVGDVGEYQEDFSWVSEYLGIQWVDEASVGKKDVASQNGLQLYIREVTKENVVFDVYSYADGNAAFAKDIKAKPIGDEMSFSFKDDGFGHSGTGNVHFRDGAIDVDIIVNDNEPLPEHVHSLAMATVMVPQVLPRSSGTDVSDFKHINDVVPLFSQTEEPVPGEDTVTYSFDDMTVVCDQSGVIRSLDVTFADEKRDMYCYERLDGTMTYDTVKLYFGKADEDYKESPTDIHVLTYHFDDGLETKFVFDTQSMLLCQIMIEYTA